MYRDEISGMEVQAWRASVQCFPTKMSLQLIISKTHLIQVITQQRVVARFLKNRQDAGP